MANELGGTGTGCSFTFRQSLAELMEKATEGVNWDEEVFRNNVENALSDGDFTLIIVVNEINKELTRIVQYGNVYCNHFLGWKLKLESITILTFRSVKKKFDIYQGN